MDSKQLRQKYLDFFKSKKHAVIRSASLIPENDPTALFTTAGMHPLVPYLLGEKHPEGKRLVDVQKCIRTVDIDEVGDNRHLTFFEMLGNWSLGDYFKKEAVEWSWEFLTDKKWLGLDPKRLYVTVFMGDKNIGQGQDEEAIALWKKRFAEAGIKAEVCPYNNPIAGNTDFRIFPLPAKDNWWGPAGQTGPCGPCTEIFYDTAPEKGEMTGTFDEEIDKFRVMEIWNDVFMEFNKKADDVFEALTQQNVDTGMGIERTVAVLNGKRDVFETDVFEPIFKKLEELSGIKYGQGKKTTRAMRIIADHLKAATFIMGDDKGIAPSNLDQGYVVRRLIRRAVRYGKRLDIKKDSWTKEIAQVVIDDYKDVYPELKRNKNFILDNLDEEEVKFKKTLEKGLRQFEKLTGNISGEQAFDLYQTYGFPIEMTKELAEEKEMKLDEHGFEQALEKHQKLSRTAAAGKFKSGLADHGEQTTKLHTAAHLLLAALRKVLGEHVIQKGSNITAERLRLDFSHGEKLTQEQLKKVESLVNQAIKDDLPVTCEEMPVGQAKKEGAMGVFESKYGEKVKVYTVGDCQIKKDAFSCEICAGPHVKRTGELGRFKITKEQSSSSGVRRIKAVLE